MTSTERLGEREVERATERQGLREGGAEGAIDAERERTIYVIDSWLWSLGEDELTGLTASLKSLQRSRLDFTQDQASAGGLWVGW